MEWVGLLVVAAVVWFVVKARRQKAEAAALKRAEALAVWETHENDPPFFAEWRVDFRTMRMTVDVEFSDDPQPGRVPEEYVVRRTRDGGRERLAELEKKGNTWEPLDAERFASLDPAYERYIRQA